MFRNLKAVGRVLYGRNSFDQLDDLISELRVEKDSFVLFLLDEYFDGKDFMKRIPIKAIPIKDQITNLIGNTASDKGISKNCANEFSKTLYNISDRIMAAILRITVSINDCSQI